MLNLTSTEKSESRGAVFHTALTALACGISVVPICFDGSKRPALGSWREYQQRCASEMQVKHWFCSEEAGIAFVTGAGSSNLEALDFDDDAIFRVWCERIRQDRELAALYCYVSWGYLEVTPSGGRHLLYRCEVPIEGNLKLACRPLEGNRRKTLIETRGQGGFIIVAPSCGRVHPSGNPYKLILGRVSSIRTITREQRRLLLDSARTFDEMPAIQKRSVSPIQTPRFRPCSQDRPGDVFNQFASWDEILTAHGWRLLYERGDEGYWTKSQHTHATTNYRGSGLLYVFSTSTVFEPERGYSKFAAYALLNHNNDFKAAARALAEKGSGSALDNRRIG